MYSSSLFALKVGVVDVEAVFNEYGKVKDARERLQMSKKVAVEEMEIFRDEWIKIGNELKALQEKVKNPKIVNPDLEEEFKEKLTLANEKREDMLAYEKRANATIMQREKNLVDETLDDIRTAIKKVASAKGLDLVIDKSESRRNVFFVSESLDYTREVIVTLNADQ